MTSVSSGMMWDDLTFPSNGWLLHIARHLLFGYMRDRYLLNLDNE